MFDWKLYNGNLTWLPARTCYLARHGSHAYGTSLPTSDEDFRGVAIAPREYYLGGVHRFDQAVCNAPDLTVFCLRKFVGLASQGNPNVLEILFVDPSDHLQISPAGERLLDARELFISRRVKHTFSGYARSQLKRIAGHYRWLKYPPKAPPTREEFNLPDRTLIPADQLAAAWSGIKQKLDSWSADFLDDLDRDLREAIVQKMSTHLAELQVASNEELWRGAARTIGYSENFIELLDKERGYANRERDWDNFLTWKKSRNPARAALEAEHGYDTKHGMHLVRLIRMCREILETGKVVVRRPDAEELLSIRHGAWSYDRLIEWAEREDAELEQLAVRSSLPKSPDFAAIDRLCVELISEAIQ
jgi:predicted nucleotidyltransferase